MNSATRVGEGDEALDRQLSAELDAVNSAAMSHAGPQRELTVRIEDEFGLVAGISGWTWGVAAGIAMTWVRADQRASGLGGELLDAFEAEARARGAQHVFVTSFTFQAPGFYERRGYVEFARWVDVPVAGQDDVHLRKELGS
ncbi:GNAT family N-acetyltransferase [Nocardioides allogilvus]|uniref:GNAT family N-acetyltransferase n=1 Tax=Nocardioides allogilvus TaxID=2072017 RepID=UPI0018E59C5F|nr:GNAT family N-acetyltransferase [Nocardioides allogilvus]